MIVASFQDTVSREARKKRLGNLLFSVELYGIVPHLKWNFTFLVLQNKEKTNRYWIVLLSLIRTLRRSVLSSKQKKPSKCGQNQLIMKFKPLERKAIQKKVKSTFSIILLAHLLQYWVVWYALFLILFFGLQDTKETVIWNVGEIGDTSALLT